MKFFISTFITGALLLTPMVYGDQNSINLTNSPYTSIASTIEEQRVANIQKNHSALLAPCQDFINHFSQQVTTIKKFNTLVDYSITTGKKLWRISTRKKSEQIKDDRSLYWARLAISQILRQHIKSFNVDQSKRESLFWQYELASRGYMDIRFKANNHLRVLITGFDPFFLDYNIEQSNPSGVAALALDGKNIQLQGQQATIESFILPVRFEDFDRGMVETVLTPYIANPLVDMAVTISMGRSHFDLERFPGLRRSSQAPDNLNIYTGASAASPLIPLLKGVQLSGPEFVEFSLPAAAMQKAAGDYQINDNHQVTTKQGIRFPNYLVELNNTISVEGSGGGYLSNEVSYRSIRLRNRYQPSLPVGHIHTPRISVFNESQQAVIVKQIEQMLILALEDI